jgi:hypothetical protein
MYGTARQATDGSIIRFAWWICKATNRQAEYVIRIALTPKQLLRELASKFIHFLDKGAIKFSLFLFGRKLVYIYIYIYIYMYVL